MIRTRPGRVWAWATATLTAIVVVPTPPLGLYTATSRRRSIGQAAADRRHGDHAARALKAQEESLDPGLELAAVERLGHDVVRARLEEADALLDVVVADMHRTGIAARLGVPGPRGRRRPGSCPWGSRR